MPPTAKLKNYIIHGEFTDTEAEKSKNAGATPEGMEDNIRDILVGIVNDIMLLEDEEGQKRAKVVIRKIRNEFTLEAYEPILQEIHDLIFHIKEIVRQEKREIFRFSQEVIKRLEEAEKDLQTTLLGDIHQIQNNESQFVDQMVNEIDSLETYISSEDLPLVQIRQLVLGKINALRQRLRLKQKEDHDRLQRMEKEKSGVENRLKDIHQRYQDFTRKSRAMLEEMQKFRQASLRDGLTGVYNRRAYDTQIKKTLEEYKAKRISTFGLIVFDIDHFKDFNNSYGHRAGDKTLIHVSRFTSETIRKEDFLFRFGGDEFVIILPEVNLKLAKQIAGKVRAAVNDVQFKIFKDSDLMVRVGLSLGVAVAHPDDDPETVFQRADKALYLAKTRGRNQIRTEKEL